MKKNSKTVKQHPAETIGVDLGDKMSCYAILNEAGVVVEEGSFRNNVESIAKHFGKQGGREWRWKWGRSRPGFRGSFPSSATK